jgi:hypothetical protein
MPNPGEPAGGDRASRADGDRPGRGGAAAHGPRRRSCSQPQRRGCPRPAAARLPTARGGAAAASSISHVGPTAAWFYQPRQSRPPLPSLTHRRENFTPELVDRKRLHYRLSHQYGRKVDFRDQGTSKVGGHGAAEAVVPAPGLPSAFRHRRHPAATICQRVESAIHITLLGSSAHSTGRPERGRLTAQPVRAAPAASRPRYPRPSGPRR